MSEAFRQSLGTSRSELREELRHGDLARLGSRLRARSEPRRRRV